MTGIQSAPEPSPYRIDPLLQPKDAAEMLGVSYVTLTRWAREGLIDFVKLPNGRRRYKESVVLSVRNGTGGHL